MTTQARSYIRDLAQELQHLLADIWAGQHQQCYRCLTDAERILQASICVQPHEEHTAPTVGTR